ncbi:MAG: Protein of unknown function (DUF1552) [Verrucomicrobia bacterium]|nr:MAG: Protein of unknown function (DUF1552) [Verrucomicrobiota bacterium]
MVCIMTPLGVHSENLFPQQTGRDYSPSPYLAELGELCSHVTVFSGLSHPEVDGGHDSERSFLTAAPHPGQASFRNSISVDQVAAEQLGADTRHASLVLNTMGGSISWARGGVQIPGEGSPGRLFAKLFLTGSQKEMEVQLNRLRQGKSVLDTVNEQAKRFASGLGQRDREKLDEYFTGVREVEERFKKAEAWAKQPKPAVEAKQPLDIQDNADLIGRTRLMYDVMGLALETDSTRIITLQLQGTGLVVPIEGVTMDHHNLSHHGKDPEKLKQLALVEGAEFKALGDFLKRLSERQEEGETLLEKTMVLFGSNLGNAASHDTKNMPIILAGGGFNHGQHLGFDAAKPPPLGNLYVQMLQQLGLPVDTFASGKSSIPGFH